MIPHAGDAKSEGIVSGMAIVFADVLQVAKVLQKATTLKRWIGIDKR